MKIKGFLTKMFGSGSASGTDLAQITSWQLNQVVSVSDMFNFEQEVYDKIKCLSDPYMNTSAGGVIISGITPLSPVANNNVAWVGGYVRFPDQVQGAPPAGNIPAANIPTNALVAYIGAGQTSTGWTGNPYLVVRFTGFVPNSTTPASVTNYAIGYSVLFTNTVNTVTDVLIAYCSSSLPAPNISSDNCAYNIGYSLFNDRSFMGVWNASSTPPTMNPAIGQTWIVQGSATLSYLNYKGTIVNVPVTNGQVLWYGYSTTSGMNQWMTLPVSMFPSINDNGQIVNIKNTLNALAGLAITGSGTLNNKNIATTDMIVTYPDIKDSGGVVSVTGAGGMSVPNGTFTSKSITDNGLQVATSKPLMVNNINTQGNGLIANFSNSSVYYNKFATGWISQGGVANLANNVATITFPLAFTQKVFSINVTTFGETGTSTGWVAVGNATTLTSFLVRSSSAVAQNQQFYWRAEGY